MALPITWLRVYRDHGPDVCGRHPATERSTAAVIKAMNEAGDLHPFRVEFHFADGSRVIASPKKRRSA